MTMTFARRSLLRVAVAAAFSAPLLAAAQQVSFATSNPGSIYHSSGQVLTKLLVEKANIKATIQPFASPNVFIPAVNAGEIQLGMANIADLTYAVQGVEHFKGKDYSKLRAIAVAYPLRSAVFVRKDSPIQSFADLKGRNAVDGFTSQKVILPILDAMYGSVGLKRSDAKPVRVPNVGGGADAFASGKADMFFFALGTAKVREVDAAVGGVRMLSLPNTDQARAALKEHYPVGYLRLEQPGPGNVGVLAPSYSVAYDALVFGSTSTSDELAYQMAKLMHDNAEDMGKAFPPLKLFDGKAMAKSLPPLQYHPGAIRYYKEIGIWKD